MDRGTDIESTFLGAMNSVFAGANVSNDTDGGILMVVMGLFMMFFGALSYLYRSSSFSSNIPSQELNDTYNKEYFGRRVNSGTRGSRFVGINEEVHLIGNTRSDGDAGWYEYNRPVIDTCNASNFKITHIIHNPGTEDQKTTIQLCKKKNLDPHLLEVYRQFIAIKDSEVKQAQVVFKQVFEQVKNAMGEQCNYFKRYSSEVLYAGSVYDGTKVSRMDEFDINIVIRLPISYEHGDNGIIIENEQPGFVKLKIGKAFDNLDNQPDWEQYHKVTRDWRDSENYLLQSKFRQWLHGIVQKALNSMQGSAEVLGVRYQLAYKESGPAYTLNIRNEPDAEPFALDVDLVPVVKFMLPRAPEGYRAFEGERKEWFVVPKPNKELKGIMQRRCWRPSFQEQERELIKDFNGLKTTIRLLKKLRDALGMKAIASYHIKTLFLWKVEENKEDKTYWRRSLGELFRIMLQDLYDAVRAKNIKFFWNEHHNLIGNLKPTLQIIYIKKLGDVLLDVYRENRIQVVRYLLTEDELRKFNESECYQNLCSFRNLAITELDDLRIMVLSLEKLKDIKVEAEILYGKKIVDNRLLKLDSDLKNLKNMLSSWSCTDEALKRIDRELYMHAQGLFPRGFLEEVYD